MESVKSAIKLAKAVYERLKKVKANDARLAVLEVRVAALTGVLETVIANESEYDTLPVRLVTIAKECTKTLTDAAAFVDKLSTAKGGSLFGKRLLLEGNKFLNANDIQGHIDSLETRIQQHMEAFTAAAVVATPALIQHRLEGMASSMSSAQASLLTRLLDVRNVAAHTAGEVTCLRSSVESALSAVDEQSTAMVDAAHGVRTGLSSLNEQLSGVADQLSARAAADDVRYSELAGAVAAMQTTVATALDGIDASVRSAVTSAVTTANTELTATLNLLVARFPAWKVAASDIGSSAERYDYLKAEAQADASDPSEANKVSGSDVVTSVLAALRVIATCSATETSTGPIMQSCEELAAHLYAGAATAAFLDARGFGVVLAALDRWGGAHAGVCGALTSVLMYATHDGSGEAAFRAAGGHRALVAVLSRCRCDPVVVDPAMWLASYAVHSDASARLAVNAGLRSALAAALEHCGDRLGPDGRAQGLAAVARLDAFCVQAALIAPHSAAAPSPSAPEAEHEDDDDDPTSLPLPTVAAAPEPSSGAPATAESVSASVQADAAVASAVDPAPAASSSVPAPATVSAGINSVPVNYALSPRQAADAMMLFDSRDTGSHDWLTSGDLESLSVKRPHYAPLASASQRALLLALADVHSKDGRLDRAEFLLLDAACRAITAAPVGTKVKQLTSPQAADAAAAAEAVKISNMLPAPSYLHMAAADGDVERLKTLLADGSVNIAVRDAFRATALHLAAERGMPAAAALLVEEGAPLNALDLAGRTPLDCALASASKGAHWLWSSGAKEVVAVLREAPGALSPYWDALMADEAMQEAEGRPDARQQHTAEANGTVLAPGAMASEAVSEGYRLSSSQVIGALRAFSASDSGRKGIIQLIDLADVSSVAGDASLAPLAHFPVRLLLLQLISPDFAHTRTLIPAITPHHFLLLAAACRTVMAQAGEADGESWHAAALALPPPAATDFEAADRSVREVNRMDSVDEAGNTDLHEAAQQGSEAQLQRLLAAGANPAVRNRLWRTPLHLAAAAGMVGAVEALLTYGAPVNARDYLGFTPLDAALAASLDRTPDAAKVAAALRRLRPHAVSPVWSRQAGKRFSAEGRRLPRSDDERRSAIAARLHHLWNVTVRADAAAAAAAAAKPLRAAEEVKREEAMRPLLAHAIVDPHRYKWPAPSSESEKDHASED